MQTEIYDLIIRMFKNELIPAESERLNRWINDCSENKRAFNEICDIWLATSWYEGENPSHVEFNALSALEKVNSRLDFSSGSPKQAKSFKFRNILKYAAIVVLLLVTAFTGYFIGTPKNPVSEETVQIESPMGSRTHVVLGDGSNLWLNGGSKIEYTRDFGEKSRDVSLSGEAYFDVRQIKDLPFVVNTTGVRIRVLGTAFNVKAYAEESLIETTLERGSLAIESINENVSGQRIVLKSGENAIYDKIKDRLQISHNIDTDVITSWKDDKLVFRNESFQGLSVKLERWYGVKIDIENDQIKSYHFNGTFEKETIQDVMDIIAYTLPVDYTIDHGVIHIRMDKNAATNIKPDL